MASSLSEALLFTTMCIVGLPVEVQVKDGSVYAGVFHTACVEKGYGVVLKKARKIGQGKCDTNLALGAFVDTLVVFSGDLVQVVVKEFLLPSEGFVGHVTSDGVEAASGVVESWVCSGDSERGAESLTSDKVSPSGGLDQNEGTDSLFGEKYEDAGLNENLFETKMLSKPSQDAHELRVRRQDGVSLEKIEEPSLMPVSSVQDSQAEECRSEGEEGRDPANEMVHDVRHLSSSLNLNGVIRSDSPIALPAKMQDSENKVPASTSLPLADAKTSTLSTSILSPDIRASSYPSQSMSSNAAVPKGNTIGNTIAKESKLNPSAKVFSPSFANSRLAHTAVPAFVSQGYIADSLPAMPVIGAQPGLDISSLPWRPSLRSKVAPYNNLVAGQSGIGAQSVRPVLGHIGTRQQPVRLTGQYHHVQAGPAHGNQNSQTVMLGRLGQLMYVHPLSQEPIQGPTVVSHGLPHPLLTPYPTNIPKLQGNAAHSLPLYMTPSVVAGGNQPLVMPSHIPFSQAFPTVRPIMVPGGNGFFGSKY